MTDQNSAILAALIMMTTMAVIIFVFWNATKNDKK